MNSLEQNFQSCEVGNLGKMEPHRVKDEKGNGEPTSPTLPMDTMKACSLGNSKVHRNNAPTDRGNYICISEEDSEPSTSNKSLPSKTEACYSQHLKHQHHRAGRLNHRPHNDRFYRSVAVQVSASNCYVLLIDIFCLMQLYTLTNHVTSHLLVLWLQFFCSSSLCTCKFQISLILC